MYIHTHKKLYICRHVQINKIIKYLQIDLWILVFFKFFIRFSVLSKDTLFVVLASKPCIYRFSSKVDILPYTNTMHIYRVICI